MKTLLCAAFRLPSLTLCEVIPCRETNGLQFAISHKLDVQVPPAGADVCRAFLPTVATDYGREPKGTVTNFNVVKLAFPGWLDGVLLIKEQLNALSGRGCSRPTGQGKGKLKAGAESGKDALKKDKVSPSMM